MIWCWDAKARMLAYSEGHRDSNLAADERTMKIITELANTLDEKSRWSMTGFFCFYFDDSCQCISSIKSTLWPSKYFNLLYIAQ